MKRTATGVGLTPADIDDVLEYLFSRSKLVQIYFRWRPVLHDPDDDRILELAIRASCSIVTFNARHFVGSERFGVRVVSPKELLTLIGDRG